MVGCHVLYMGSHYSSVKCIPYVEVTCLMIFTSEFVEGDNLVPYYNAISVVEESAVVAYHCNRK